MDFLTFASNAISALAWPGTVIAAIYFFKKELKDLINRIKQISWNDFAVICREMDALEAEAETKLPASPTKSEIRVQDTLAIPSNERVVLKELYPPVIMLQAWYSLEAELRKLAARHHLPKSEDSKTLTLANELQSKGVMDEAAYSIFTSLRNLRNRVVHVRPESVTSSQAEKYDSIVQRLITKLQKL